MLLPRPCLRPLLSLCSAVGLTCLLPIQSMAQATIAPTVASCTPTAATNRRIVESFYDMALNGRKTREAFQTYMAPDFVDHKPDLPRGTRDAATQYLEGLIRDFPAPHWERLRTIAENDLVVLHVRFTPAEGAEPYAIADLFRLKDCHIVEHWDVVAGPPKQQTNPTPRF